jgi:hypothetical protein
MNPILAVLVALLLAPLAALHAADSSSSVAPRDDAAWLREKGVPIFHDAFEREETGTAPKVSRTRSSVGSASSCRARYGLMT